MNMNGRLTLVTAPDVTPVNVDDVTRHTEAPADGYNTDILEAFIAAATAHVDGPTGVLGRALVQQVWDYKIDCFPCHGASILMPLPPLQSVTSIGYVDGDGATQTWGSGNYQVVGAGAEARAEIVEAYGAVWPVTRRRREAVTIRFTCGYPAADEELPEHIPTVPDPIRHAIIMMVADMYRFRETVEPGALSAVPMSLPVKALLTPFRVGCI